MANLLIWWRQRTPSEQRLLLGLTGLLAACAFWYGLWQPWRAREAQWRQTLVKEQASLRWMTEQAPRLQQLSQQPAPAAKEALTALVMREAASHGLTVVRLQPQGKRLQITLQPCAFQVLIDWHGERLERLAWSLTLAGWQVSLSDPRGVMGQARLWGLRDLRLQEGRLTAPASMLSRWLMSTMPVKAAGEVTFSLTEGRFSDGRCRHIIAGGAQWRQARLHSPVGSLELAQVNGTFRCTVDGAVALTLRQDSHQLSLSGQGTLSPDGRYLFRGTLQPRQGMPPLLALLVTRPTANNAPGPTPWQLQGKWLPQEQK